MPKVTYHACTHMVILEKKGEITGKKKSVGRKRRELWFPHGTDPS